MSLSSEFESLKNSNDFYKAKICLSHINKHRNMISKSYLIYYQINLHLNKRLSSKALARFRYYKTFEAYFLIELRIAGCLLNRGIVLSRLLSKTPLEEPQLKA